MDYLVTAQALNESDVSKDWDRFCKYALPVAVAAAQQEFLRLNSFIRKHVLNEEAISEYRLPYRRDQVAQAEALDQYSARQFAQDAAQDALFALMRGGHAARPDRMYVVVQRAARFAARDAHKADHGGKDRVGREARQLGWFEQRYAFNSWEEQSADPRVSDQFQCEVYERDQLDPLDQLAELEESQLVRDTLLNSEASWSEVLSAYYVDEVPAEVLQERYGLGRRGFYKRLASAREALQSSLSTSAHV